MGASWSKRESADGACDVAHVAGAPHTVSSSSTPQTSTPSLHVLPPSYKGATLQPGPPEFLAQLTDLMTISTDAITIKFPILTGNQLVEFSWYKDGRPIRDSRYESSQGPSWTSLSIRGVQVHDAGTFLVKASNKYGSVSSSCNLHVLDIRHSKAIINNSRVSICQAANIDEMLPYLKQYRVVSVEQQRRILAMRSPALQADALIDCVLEGDVDNCRVLFYVLRMMGKGDLVDKILMEGASIQSYDDEWSKEAAYENFIYDPSRFDILDEDEFYEYKNDGLSIERIMAKDKKLKEKIDAVLQNYYLPENKPPPTSPRLGRLNIVFIGKTGVGKSASANTFIGQEVFEKLKTAKSVTQSVGVHDFQMDSRDIRVVDTPGLVDTDVAPEVTALELAKVLDVCPDGVHAFLYLQDATTYRFTEEQQKVKEQVLHIFGQDILQHTAMVMTHADGVFKKCSLREYLDHDIVDSPLEVFIKQELSSHIVAIDNEVDTRYARTFMRQALLDITDKVISAANSDIYTHDMFKLAAKLRDKSESARSQELARLQRTDKDSFREAFKLARAKAHALAEDHFKNKSLLEVRMERESEFEYARELLEKDLRTALWRSDSNALGQLENLRSGSSCPLTDIIEESVHLAVCAHMLKQARREGNEMQIKRYKILADLHDYVKKMTRRGHKKNSENDYQPTSPRFLLPGVGDYEGEEEEEEEEEDVSASVTAAAEFGATNDARRQGAAAQSEQSASAVTASLSSRLDGQVELLQNEIRQLFLENVPASDLCVLTEEELEEEVLLLAHFASLERRYEELIKGYLSEIDRAIWEEIQIHVRKLTYYQWKQIGEQDFNQVYVQVAYKLSAGAVKYFSESRIKEEIKKQTMNKRDNLEKLVMSISNMIRSVIKQVFTSCAIM